MSFLKAMFFALFRHQGSAEAVQGGGGHYNEQCHPQQYN